MRYKIQFAKLSSILVFDGHVKIFKLNCVSSSEYE